MLCDAYEAQQGSYLLSGLRAKEVRLEIVSLTGLIRILQVVSSQETAKCSAGFWFARGPLGRFSRPDVQNADFSIMCFVWTAMTTIDRESAASVVSRLCT
jgi:hypothetical protein